MRLAFALALAAGLALAAAPQRALADAIPMPETLSAEQALLLGVWQEEAPARPAGRGHHFTQRTLGFANSEATLLSFGGVAPSRIYETSALRGAWSAERKDKATLVVTLTTPEGGSMTLTLTFDGADSFTLHDTSSPNLRASTFRRVTAPFGD